ncbi:MAG: hypothetical protein C4325_06905, partial [Blastocatellia bacterium]
TDGWNVQDLFFNKKIVDIFRRAGRYYALQFQQKEERQVITFKDFRRKRRFLAVKLLAVLLSLVILNESSDAQKNRNILILQSKTENLLTSRRKRTYVCGG